MTRAEIHVRPAGEADIAAIADLFLATYRRALDVELYRWKVWGQVVEAATAWVAEIDGVVVGHRSGTPFTFLASGRPLRGMHACHAMTHPAYRRRGVLTALCEAAYAAWARAHVDLVLGVPAGEGWDSRRSDHGWQQVGTLGWRRRPLRLDRMLARRAPGGRLLGRFAASVEALLHSAPTVSADLCTREIADPGGVSDALLAKVGRRYPALVRRDGRWMDYRYRRAPGRSYRFFLTERRGGMAGLLVARVESDAGRRTGLIADVMTEPGDADAVRALLDATIVMMRAEDVDDARVLAMPDTWLDSELGRAGFFRTRGVFPISIIPLADPDLTRRPSTDWFFTGGDFDVV